MAEEEEGLDLGRYFRALLRYKWLIALTTALGVGAGFVITRFIAPEYEAQTTLWLETQGGTGADGPIRPGELLEDYAWADLLRSYVVMEPVIMEEQLFLTPARAQDRALFEGFELEERFVPGTYELRVSENGDRLTLAQKDGEVVGSGSPGASLSNEAGFIWTPPATRLEPGRTVVFTVASPRDGARRLARQLNVSLDRTGNFMTISLRGEDPEYIAGILNHLVDRYVDVAAQLKRHRLDEQVRILGEQLEYARENLEQAEDQLESYRVETIALPSEPAAPLAAGIDQTRQPVFSNYFGMRVELEDIRRDRGALERELASAREGEVRVEALEAIGSVRSYSDLMRVLGELSDLKSERRALLNRYTEQAPPVREVTQAIDEMSRNEVPRHLEALIRELDTRRDDLNDLVESATGELRQIPTRAIQESNLERRVGLANEFYQNLSGRYEEAQLASASSIADMQVLDYAHVPREPASDDAPRFFFLAIVAGLALGTAGALLLDRTDRKVRHPDQITDELGLPILGTIPRIHKRRGQIRPEDEEQMVEALRGIRLNLTHAYGAAGPMIMGVTSAGIGDGKSFVSANLAVAFAELGQRTLLLDGDVRRGSLHRLLGLERKPGLTDALSGEVPLSDVVRETDYESLHLIASGTRLTDGPELLASPRMRELVGDLKGSYDVIIVDVPPLGAAVDPLIVGTLAGNLLMVLRNGASDREFAEAKLETVDRLPIRMLGAVLNDVPLDSHYRYYAYLPGYTAADEEERRSNGKRKGSPVVTAG